MAELRAIGGNNYYIARALFGQWDYDELERRALWRANEQKPDAILVEDDGGFGTVLIGAPRSMRPLA